mgnify:FL=1
MKKLLAPVLALCLLLSLIGCAGQPTEKVYTVGICQLVTHEALDAATQGFKDALIEALGEEHVKFDEQNAAGSPDVCTTIANNFASKNVDLILANATSALQACANATATIPILGTSITEYGVALGIDNFTGTVGGNISGTSDLAPLDQQAQMIVDLFPSYKTVGLLYCSAEPNSQYQIKVVRTELERRGLTTKEYTFSDTNDVAAVAQKASEDCEVLYIPTDNTAASCAPTIYSSMTRKVPVVCGDTGTLRGCGVAALSTSYYELGMVTGKMAAKILKGEAKVGEMPIEYASAVKVYNPVICEELQLQVPADYQALD